jgi:hypothetical protein
VRVREEDKAVRKGEGQRNPSGRRVRVRENSGQRVRVRGNLFMMKGAG